MTRLLKPVASRTRHRIRRRQNTTPQVCGQGKALRSERLLASRNVALANENRKHRALLRGASDGVHILDAAGRLVEASHVFFRMLGYTRDELIGQPATTWWPDEQAGPLPGLDDNCEWQTLDGAISVQFRRKDGSLLDVEMTAVAIELDGKAHISLSARDISERKNAAAQIRQLAFYDPLTGLPNRRLLLDRLGKALALATRNGRMMAVLFLDLDRFKHINDTLGHDAGDELLQVVASRLLHCVRAGDTVARLGGDEFVIVLAEIAAARDAELVAQKIIGQLAEPVRLFGEVHYTSTSIGISVYPGHGSLQLQAMLQQADGAMYQAKQTGRNRYCLASATSPAAS